MGPEDRRGGRGFTDDEFEGRDLLVGRPQGAKGRPGGGAEQSPTAATPSQAGAHDEDTREILETVRATAAKVDALEAASGSDPENETGDALARETAALATERAALARAVEAASGSLAKTEALAARWEEKGSSEASVLSQGVAALKEENAALKEANAALGRRIEEARQLAQTVIDQMHKAISEGKAVYDSKIELQETAKDMHETSRVHAESLGVHAENMLRINRNHRLRPLRIGVVSHVVRPWISRIV